MRWSTLVQLVSSKTCLGCYLISSALKPQSLVLKQDETWEIRFAGCEGLGLIKLARCYMSGSSLQVSASGCLERSNPGILKDLRTFWVGRAGFWSLSIYVSCLGFDYVVFSKDLSCRNLLELPM